MQYKEQSLDDDCVLIAGGGPIGMLLANVLAYYGVKSLVLERNETTTKWPKMDLTNARSMEHLRKIGFANLVREKGVPSHFSYNVLLSTGLNSSEAVSKWELSSVDHYRKMIKSSNDGSSPQEPYQRISQALFEAAVRTRCDENPLIDLRFGWRVELVEEAEHYVKVTCTELKNGDPWLFKSRYVVGCDGASSKVRRSLQIPLDGGPTPIHALLVHFKSRDLKRLHKQGQFWHIFTASKTGGITGAIIAQDEVDTWTVHRFLPVEEDGSNLSSDEIVATVLGGITGPYPVQIDEVLVRSTYRPHIAVARTYVGGKAQRVLLAGDSAHQNIPTGGYGMNMGIGDAFGLGWQLAAVIKGYGGKGLLQAYEQERRPVALTSVEHSGKHLAVHAKVADFLAGDVDDVDANTTEAKELRNRLHKHYQENDGENRSIGIEMGYRYQSAVIISDNSAAAPAFDARRYIPSTWPGMRAPHMFLKDGREIFDEFGPVYTLVEFKDGENHGAELLVQEAARTGVPLKHLCLEGENEAHTVWGRRLVLVRPDFHVAWRGEKLELEQDAVDIMRTITGFGVSTEVEGEEKRGAGHQFTSAEAHNTQLGDFGFDGIGEMQK